jgi:hypothetical protein
LEWKMGRPTFYPKMYNSINNGKLWWTKTKIYRRIFSYLLCVNNSCELCFHFHVPCLWKT